MPKILIVEDDSAFRQMLSRFLTKNGFEVSQAHDIKEARNQIDEQSFEIVLSDVRLPEGNGQDLLKTISSDSAATKIILMTGYGEVKSAVEAMKKGAFDYVTKPFTPEQILQVITDALKSAPADIKTLPKSSTYATAQNQDFIEGVSLAGQQMLQYIKLVSPTNMSVLLRGESGTGKEVTAKTIHQNSNRKNKAFIPVDCGAIPKEIATSEFFGHLKGSFTGAVEDKIGHFEAANGGTLFLDEIGNLSYENQVQLLRALQERKIKRVGSTKEIEVDVRIIAATNEDLDVAVEEGRFREDLYHRLNEFTISIPPLRERNEDIKFFAEQFLKKANQELERNVALISEEALEILENHTWPGNLRELKNTIKRAVLFTEGDVLMPLNLPQEIQDTNPSLTFSKSTFEKERILQALRKTNFNKSKAAQLLNITRKTLYNKINQYQLDV
ncbi:MAG: sigma-54 dependent transcriptional regulator [Bacteroidota bacterium]